MAQTHKQPQKDREVSQAENTETDPVLAMLGVGKQLWESESGDRFVERLRSEELPAPPSPQRSSGPAESLPDAVWQRVADHQGEEFRTARGLPFTFEVEGLGFGFSAMGGVSIVS
jgi:hypothetical protein